MNWFYEEVIWRIALPMIFGVLMTFLFVPIITDCTGADFIPTTFAVFCSFALIISAFYFRYLTDMGQSLPFSFQLYLFTACAIAWIFWWPFLTSVAENHGVVRPVLEQLGLQKPDITQTYYQYEYRNEDPWFNKGIFKWSVEMLFVILSFLSFRDWRSGY